MRKAHYRCLMIAFCILAFSPQLFARDQEVRAGVTLLLTSNLEGRFLPAIEGQEKNDPLILLGQSISYEMGRRDLIYLDLGNSFYPGVVSRYSYGSAAMEFLTAFGCQGTLVSSKDMQTGVRNLEFLQRPGVSPLLSANISRNGKHVFTPYIVHRKGNVSIAFVGLSSERILFNVAEKHLYQMQLDDAGKSLEGVFAMLDGSDVKHVVLISGLDYEVNVQLMKKYPRIALLISGSDNNGTVADSSVQRVDISDGRTIISTPSREDYYLVEIEAGDGLSVKDMTRKSPAFYRVSDEQYNSFISRITRWKSHLIRELDRSIADMPGTELAINYENVGGLLRDTFNAELAVIDGDALSLKTVNGSVSRMDLLSAIHDDYSIFEFELSGSDLKKIIEGKKRFYVAGQDKGKVQGYEIVDARNYRVVATQPVVEFMEKVLGHPVKYSNTWKSMTDVAVEDLEKSKPSLLKNDYSCLENRFRNTVDIMLSFFYENNDVSRGSSIDTPPGKPEESYVKWGMENRIDWTIYNRYHMLVLTPYIYYVRQDDQYLNNLLRGTVFYRVNFDYFLRPYHKSQVDSVLFDVEGLRPTIIRETFGADMEFLFLRGRFGTGFEKQIHDPVEPVVYGLEVLVSLEYKFLKHFSYNLGWDSFMALGRMSQDQRYLRSELFNSLSFRLNRLLGFSFKYRWFYYYSFHRREQYSSSQFITSADVKTDFKIW